MAKPSRTYDEVVFRQQGLREKTSETRENWPLPACPPLRHPHLHGTPGSIPQNTAALAEGDAHVIRNAGGRASDDAIRSLVISP